MMMVTAPTSTCTIPVVPALYSPHPHSLSPYTDHELLRMLETCPWGLEVYGKTIELVRLGLREKAVEFRASRMTSLLRHRPTVLLSWS